VGVGLGSRRRGAVRGRQAARALSPAGRPGPARQSQAVEVLNRAPLCPRSAPDAEHRPPPVAVTNAVADAPFGDAHPRHERDELTARHDCDPGGAGVIAAREVKESLDGLQVAQGREATLRPVGSRAVGACAQNRQGLRNQALDEVRGRVSAMSSRASTTCPVIVTMTVIASLPEHRA